MSERVNELFKRYKESGDISVRNEIAEKYLYIAEILAKKFVGRGVEYDDLKQVASYALLRGIDRFDPDLGMQFTTFITPTITGELKIISAINQDSSKCLGVLAKSMRR